MDHSDTTATHIFIICIYIYIYIYTLWLFNIAMENCPFIDDFPTKTSIHKGFPMAMLNNQMVIICFFYVIQASMVQIALKFLWTL